MTGVSAQCESCHRQIVTSNGGTLSKDTVLYMDWHITDDGRYFCPTHNNQDWPAIPAALLPREV